VDPCIWKEVVRKDAHQKAMRPCNRDEGGVCTEEGKDISTVKRRERRGT